MSDELFNPQEIIDSKVKVSKVLIVFNIVAALIYMVWWFDLSHMGNPWLYLPLLFGEIYHVFQAIGYAITVWDQSKLRKPRVKYEPDVDVFITVCGEPTAVVKNTVEAAMSMDYPKEKLHVYVLNDGKGRNAPNWEEVNGVVSQIGAQPITRDVNIGAKAGNINNAMANTKSPYIVVFDADHVPHKDFLRETIPYFVNPKIALVQAPQFYKNKDQEFLTTAAWEQQELFFGPICRGKNLQNATFWCGTNAVVNRKALESIGGVPENNIAEDFLASLKMHQNGWESVYVPKILAKGLAPQDLQNYVTQQFRWARGSSELMFRYNPILNRKLTFWQKLQYLYSSSYYLNGFIVLIDILVPIIVLSTGVIPVVDESASFILFFMMFILSTLYLLLVSTSNTITFAAVQLSMSSAFVFIQAVFATLFGIKSNFKVTSKEAEQGNYLRFAVPHFLYAIIGIFAILYAIYVNGLTPSVITNASWITFNIVMFFGFIRVAYPWERLLYPFVYWFNDMSRDFGIIFNKVSSVVLPINIRRLIFGFVQPTETNKHNENN